MPEVSLPVPCWSTHGADSHTPQQLGALPKPEQSQIFLLILSLNMDSELIACTFSIWLQLHAIERVCDRHVSLMHFLLWLMWSLHISQFCVHVRQMVAIQVASRCLYSHTWTHCMCAPNSPSLCPSHTNLNCWNEKKYLFLLTFSNTNKILVDQTDWFFPVNKDHDWAVTWNMFPHFWWLFFLCTCLLTCVISSLQTQKNMETEHR